MFHPARFLMCVVIVVLSLLSPLTTDAQDDLPHTYLSRDGAITFRYPAGWIVQDREGVSLLAQNESAFENVRHSDDQFIMGVTSLERLAESLGSDELEVNLTLEGVLANLIDQNQVPEGLSVPTLITIGDHEAVHVQGSVGDELEMMLLIIEMGPGAFVLIQCHSGIGGLESLEPIILAIAESVSYHPTVVTNPIVTLSVEGDAAGRIAFSPDGQWLGLASGGLHLWQLPLEGDLDADAIHATRRTLTIPDQSVTDFAFSPDSALIATGNTDNSVYLWDLALADHVAVLTGHTDSVWSLAFSPDGTLLASAGRSGTCIVWDISDPSAPVERLVIPGEKPQWIHYVAFKSKEQTLIASNQFTGTVQQWDLVSGELVSTLEQDLSDITVFGVDSMGITAGFGTRKGELMLLNLTTGDRTEIPDVHVNERGPIPLSGVAVNREGSLAVSAALGSKIVRLWDITTGQQVGIVRLAGWGIYEAAFSPDSAYLATSTRAVGVQIWDISAISSH